MARTLKWIEENINDILNGTIQLENDEFPILTEVLNQNPQLADLVPPEPEENPDAVFFEFIKNGDIETLQDLLDLGTITNINATNPDGDTALHIAAQPLLEGVWEEEMTAMAKFLLECGIDPTIVNNAGETAFMTAIHYDNQFIAALLEPHEDTAIIAYVRYLFDE